MTPDATDPATKATARLVEQTHDLATLYDTAPAERWAHGEPWKSLDRLIESAEKLRDEAALFRGR